jgi:hypothetical protein
MQTRQPNVPKGSLASTISGPSRMTDEYVDALKMEKMR